MTDRHAGGSAKRKLTPLEQAAMRLSEHCVAPARPSTGSTTPIEGMAGADSPTDTVLVTQPVKLRQKTGGPQ